MRSLQIRDHFVTKTVIWTDKDIPGYGPWAPLLWGLGVEPTVAFEPTTPCLQSLVTPKFPMGLLAVRFCQLQLISQGKLFG